MRAGVYVRISQDREGAGLGVARQEEDCRALCLQLGWEVAEVYVDNDTSAYSGKPRKNWERLISDVTDGAVQAIVGWHVDRLTRTPRELEDIIDLAERYGVHLATVTGEIDLATPTGRMVARIMGAAARQEAEHKAERQRRQRRQAAEQGRYAGGGARPYGYADDRVTVVESEAAVIRECARRVLAGETLSSVVRDLQARGVTTAAGKPWLVTKLRKMLISARISGRREYTPRRSGESRRPAVGEIVGDAQWPAIISPEDSDRLRALLTNPNRRTFTPGTGRTYLLSGILKCAVCKTPLTGRPRSGVPRYVCPNTPGKDSCGGVATNAARTDTFVRDLVLVALDTDEMKARLRARRDSDPDLYQQIKRDEDELEALAAERAGGEITRKEWAVAREIVQKRLDGARARLARMSRTAALENFVGTYDEMLERWNDDLNDSQRRAVVGAVLNGLWVGKANPRKKWDPDRFSPDWRV